MSLILDALRKMEQERKARSGVAADIRPEVIGRPAPAPAAKKKPYVLVAAGAAILVAGIGAGLFLKGGGSEKPPEEAKLADRSTKQPAASPAPALQAPPAAVPPAVAATPVTPAPPQPVAPPVASPVAAPVRQQPRQPAVEPEQQPVAHQTASDLSVSGIAWQDERSLRRAVVNGILVGEGAEIAGARVVEIGERRVRFSRGGQSITISLSSPFPAR